MGSAPGGEVTFPSTILPQTSDPQEIQKAVLDLLDKINRLGGAPGAVSINPVADTAANFTSKNPVLSAGQLGYETDTKFFKFGDGSTAYNSLSYQSVKNAPLPQTAAGVGQWIAINGGAGNAIVLPAGGTWYWCVMLGINAGLVVNGATGGISAGGTTIQAAVAGVNFQAFYGRIT
jgi:hypothetical protein